jgi:hypothetical protein
MPRIAPLTLLLVLLLRVDAGAAPVEPWEGSWSVRADAASVATFTRTVEQTLPGQLTLVADLPLEGKPRTIELTGGPTPGGLSLDALWIEGIGFVGALSNEPMGKKHTVGLRAMIQSQDGATVTAVARFLVDGAVVKQETWHAAATLELVGLELQGKPLAGEFDAKLSGPLLARYRVRRGSLALHAHVDLGSGHPAACFYGSPTLFETDLGTVAPGEYEVSWNGRDATAAKRIAIGGPYRFVIEPSPPASPAGPGAGEGGLPAPVTGSAPGESVGAVVAPFSVAAARLELLCSDWPENYANVKRPRWSEGPALASSAAYLTSAPGGLPGFQFESPRVLSSATAAAGYFKQSAVALVETHGNADMIAFYSGDPSKPWQSDDPEDGITGRYFNAGDLGDLHFAFVITCDGAVVDDKGHSFVADLRDAGCDVAIGFAATIAVSEGVQFRDLVFQLVAAGTPVEKAARDAVRTTYAEDHPQTTHFLFIPTGSRPPTDAQMNAMIDAERSKPADPNVDYGIKSLASCIVVERGNGIPADESMWPPRYGSSTN